MRDPRLPSSTNSPNVGSTSDRRPDSLHLDPRTMQWSSSPSTSRGSQPIMNSPAHHLQPQQSHQDYASTSRGQFMEPRNSQNLQDQRSSLQYRPSQQPSHSSSSTSSSSPPQYYSLSPPESIPRSAPPPAPVHRVYVLNCATCDTFLTNRGMRVSRLYFFR